MAITVHLSDEGRAPVVFADAVGFLVRDGHLHVTTATGTGAVFAPGSWAWIAEDAQIAGGQPVVRQRRMPPDERLRPAARSFANP